MPPATNKPIRTTFQRGMVTNAAPLVQHKDSVRKLSNLMGRTAGQHETRPGLRLVKWQSWT